MDASSYAKIVTMNARLVSDYKVNMYFTMIKEPNRTISALFIRLRELVRERRYYREI